MEHKDITPASNISISNVIAIARPGGHQNIPPTKVGSCARRFGPLSPYMQCKEVQTSPHTSFHSFCCSIVKNDACQSSHCDCFGMIVVHCSDMCAVIEPCTHTHTHAHRYALMKSTQHIHTHMHVCTMHPLHTHFISGNSISQYPMHLGDVWVRVECFALL